MMVGFGKVGVSIFSKGKFSPKSENYFFIENLEKNS
jgi:hypothetical protein